MAVDIHAAIVQVRLSVKTIRVRDTLRILKLLHNVGIVSIIVKLLHVYLHNHQAGIVKSVYHQIVHSRDDRSAFSVVPSMRENVRHCMNLNSHIIYEINHSFTRQTIQIQISLLLWNCVMKCNDGTTLL